MQVQMPFLIKKIDFIYHVITFYHLPMSLWNKNNSPLALIVRKGRVNPYENNLEIQC